MEYIVIPAPSKKKLSSSTQPWDSTSPDSDCLSPKNIEHKAVVHTHTSNETSKNSSPLYETIRQTLPTCYTTEKCFISSDEENPTVKFDHLQDDCSSACSTPLAKLRARIKDAVTPGLHRSDSTEYCSILSPDTRLNNFGLTDDSVKDQSSERPTAKLSRSFTPKSYKPLQIKVPEYNLDSIKTLLKEQNGTERSSYNFNIKNYSLPTTPIARSNKLRKNAWLSGELNENKFKVEEKMKGSSNMHNSEETKLKVFNKTLSSTEPSLEKDAKFEVLSNNNNDHGTNDAMSTGSFDTVRDSFTGLRRVELPPADFPASPLGRARSLGSVDEALSRVYVAPLVALHERAILQAQRPRPPRPPPRQTTRGQYCTLQRSQTES
ncbi:unnamed protein product [Euphydryas editha]|uniref:Uncharacterized protein n=1 Tax=Euphydryas editha TaxID=104508 RepID=A0AAU9TJI6_EUPED|nr:unnamed protein product [Euphydryas editha]